MLVDRLEVGYTNADTGSIFTSMLIRVVAVPGGRETPWCEGQACRHAESGYRSRGELQHRGGLQHRGKLHTASSGRRGDRD